ncbi:hypothetical protein A2U01_0005119 [Trifolium medium]|uniref:Uncharacterized protein n=1 Tax=Trifolium medium TaxID=97028 RepID=A0A392MBW2_9FABA|nr:hypothetical protein [Trifolium medium]
MTTSWSWRSEPHYAENALEIIKEEVHQIYNNNASRSFEELYRVLAMSLLMKDVFGV